MEMPERVECLIGPAPAWLMGWRAELLIGWTARRFASCGFRKLIGERRAIAPILGVLPRQRVIAQSAFKLLCGAHEPNEIHLAQAPDDGQRLVFAAVFDERQQFGGGGYG